MESGKNYPSSFKVAYRRQISFQQKVENVSDLPVDNPVKFQYHMTAMTEELGEILKADKRWKTHRNDTHIPHEKLDELADVFITAMNIGIWSGFTAEQVLEAIYDKIMENHKRIDGER